MINKDIVYIVCFILIIINCIIYSKNNIPTYTKSIIFKIIFLLCMLVISNYNLYIGTFLGITFLNII